MNNKCIICDIDGVLADHSHRIKYARSQEWDKYHSLAPDDPPHPSIVHLLIVLRGYAKVVFSTGRPVKYKEQTEEWLKRHDLPCDGDLLMMRSEEDLRSNVDVKHEHLFITLQNNTVWFAIDDMTSVKDMYLKEGIMCLQPHELEWGEKAEDGMDEPDGPWAEGWEVRNDFSVPSILETAANTYKDRQNQYGEIWKIHGKIMSQFFPEGITLKTEDDFLRYHLFVLEVIKLTRTAGSGLNHLDSQHDNIVYSAMFESVIRGGVK